MKELKTLETQRVLVQANRCLLCYDPPCSKVCPHHAAPADFIQSIRFDNMDTAFLNVKESGISKECVQDCAGKYCEKACLRAKIDGPVEIFRIHRYLTQQ